MCAFFASDAHLRFTGAGQASPLAVTAQGVSEFRPLLALMIKSFKLEEPSIHSLIIDGRQAVVHWQTTSLSRISGLATPTELVDLVEFRGDRIASYVEFFASRKPPLY